MQKKKEKVYWYVCSYKTVKSRVLVLCVFCWFVCLEHAMLLLSRLGSLPFVLFMDRKGSTTNNCKDVDGIIWMGCVVVGGPPSVSMPSGEEIPLRWLLPSIDFQNPGQSP